MVTVRGAVMGLNYIMQKFVLLFWASPPLSRNEWSGPEDACVAIEKNIGIMKFHLNDSSGESGTLLCIESENQCGVCALILLASSVCEKFSAYIFLLLIEPAFAWL
ncbi:hypothetical protein [Micavibrio aeruginosavorus]|uniref:hypothetical protein n=1 Tax=Micavibrio aeruginosavorus TaxID=349221 RepID=UPI003F4AEB9B